jgi:hypothetical protein
VADRLGRAGRAGSEQDHRFVVRADRIEAPLELALRNRLALCERVGKAAGRVDYVAQVRQRGAGPAAAQLAEQRVAPCELVDEAVPGQLGARDEDRRAAAPQRVVDLLRRRIGVERNRDGAREAAGVPGDGELGCVAEQKRDRGARLDAERDQRARQRAASLVKRGIAERTALVQQRGPRAVPRGLRGDEAAERQLAPGDRQRERSLARLIGARISTPAGTRVRQAHGRFALD